MQNASCTGIDSGCQLLQGKAIDVVLSICHLIMPDSSALFKGAVIKQRCVGVTGITGTFFLVNSMLWLTLPNNWC